MPVLTYEQVRKLSDASLKLEVAKLMGWREVDRGICAGWLKPDARPTDRLHTASVIPEYPTSLDAIRPVEETVKDEHGYWDWLIFVVGGQQSDYGSLRAVGTAPARMRAEAYVLHKLIGKRIVAEKQPDPDCPYCHGEGVTGGIDNRTCHCLKKP